jgi:hypothetical protein
VVAASCRGEIDPAGSFRDVNARGGAGAGATAGPSPGAGGDGAGAGADGGLPGVPDGPGVVDATQPPRFVCADPATRGRGQPAMRRLTRDELLHTIGAVVGSAVLEADAVVSAAARIPAEPPGDLVATFQNGHAFDHVEGLLLASQAIAAEVAREDGARERVLGTCADGADRACAEAFVDGAALRLMRRPLDAARRAALLAAFDAEGGGLAAMQWLLARVLQAPETVFHLELPRRHCTPGVQAEPNAFAWDDASASFVPNGAAMTGPQAEITQIGWYVWQIPGARVPAAFVELTLELTATAADGAPIELDVNLNDTPLLPGVQLAAGDHTLRADVAIAAGSDVKVGVYFKNAADGRALALRRLSLRAPADTLDCAAAPAQDGLFEIDDWSVASRLAYALTGEGPDAELLAAAAQGELGSEQAVRPHAERLIATPAARRQLEAVLDAWLNLHAIPTPHPTIAALAGVDASGLADEARRELLDYAVHLVIERDADTTALMSTRLGFPRSERMATLYGSEQADGEQPIELTRGHGGMLLRLAPLLSGQLGSSPILRGVYVRKRILCDTLPSPDFSIVNSRLEEFAAQDRSQLTTREAVTEITSQGACPTCHVQINPIGFALETFDPLGQPRSEEIVWGDDGEELARHPIDTHVTDANLEPGAPSALQGAEDLNAALAGSAKVRACIAERFYSHARLRPAAEADACGLAEVEQHLRKGGSIKEAWLRAVVNRELLVRETQEELAP